MAKLHEPWGRRKGNHDHESLLRVDLRTTTTASFSDNEEQVCGGNPKTACGEAAEKNGSREKKRSSREKTKRRTGGKKRNCCGSWWGAVKTCWLIRTPVGLGAFCTQVQNSKIIYIYIYIHVCVCVCAPARSGSLGQDDSFWVVWRFPYNLQAAMTPKVYNSVHGWRKIMCWNNKLKSLSVFSFWLRMLAIKYSCFLTSWSQWVGQP